MSCGMSVATSTGTSGVASGVGLVASKSPRGTGVVSVLTHVASSPHVSCSASQRAATVHGCDGSVQPVWGVPQPTASWGSMIAAGKDYYREDAALMLYPGLTLAVVVLAFTIVGDGISKAVEAR